MKGYIFRKCKRPRCSLFGLALQNVFAGLFGPQRSMQSRGQTRFLRPVQATTLSRSSASASTSWFPSPCFICHYLEIPSRFNLMTHFQAGMQVLVTSFPKEGKTRHLHLSRQQEKIRIVCAQIHVSNIRSASYLGLS